MPINQYKIIPAWNNAGNLVNVESIAVSGATRYLNHVIKGLRFDTNTSYFVSADPITENLVYLADGSDLGQGYDRTAWLFRFMSDIAFQYWRTTYRGKMTIATKEDKYGTYANWNAIVGRPQITREQRKFAAGIWWYQDVIVPIKLVGAPT